MATNLAHLASEEVFYLTTIGRVSGRPHKVELWFALNGQTLYILHEGVVGDWIKNVERQPDVLVTIKDTQFTGKARLVKDRKEDELARQLLAGKYQKSADHLVEWVHAPLCFAVDLTI
ncbi:nitroreductase/quinone reductase family protein [Ktedonosporobacter rubrisoli]|nr:nitroreductase/quinone reductase family protein [Ktedonosporobacter rubrisoli]